MWRALVFILIVSLPASATVRRHAIVIGLHYDDLVYGDRDASSFRDFLYQSLGFENNDIEFLINKEATRDGILTAIANVGRYVRNDANNGDQSLVYIYYSGHSVTDDAGQAYFLTYNSNPAIPNTGLGPAEFLREIKTRIQATQIVYFFDTCYAAAAENGGRSKSIPTNAYSAIDAIWAQYFPKSQGLRMGFLSSAANQKSYESKALQHGIFTYYLLEGLKGKADEPPNGNGDGRITAGELMAYLSHNVGVKAKAEGHSQDPIPTPVFDPEFPLAYTGVTEVKRLFFAAIPVAALTTLREYLNAGQKILGISFDPAGNWAVIGDKQYSAPQEVVADVKNYLQQYGDQSVSGISLFQGGNWVTFGTNGSWRHNAPEALKNLHKTEAMDKKVSVRDLIVVNQQEYVFLVEKNGYWYSGIPPEMVAQLKSLNAAGKEITHIAVKANGGWVVIYDGYKSVGKTIPQDMVDALTLLENHRQNIQAITFDAATNGWVIVADK